MSKKNSKKQPVSFEIIPLDETPSRKYTKGSKYDPIIDSFVTKGIELGSVRVTKDDSTELLDANYLRTQLAKRLKARELTDSIVATVVNDICYLKKV